MTNAALLCDLRPAHSTAGNTCRYRVCLWRSYSTHITREGAPACYVASFRSARVFNMRLLDIGTSVAQLGYGSDGTRPSLIENH